MASIFNRWFGKTDKSSDRDVAALAAPYAVPALHVIKTAAPSRSHFGGMPNLPSEIEWPERDGRKLEFLARLSLPEIQRALPIEWLPDAGALLFFYDRKNERWGFDPKDRGSWSVILAADVPAEKTASALPHRNVTFRRIDVLPALDRELLQPLGLSSSESDTYCDTMDAVFAQLPKHQVAGFPSPIQDDEMERQCQLVSHGVYCGGGTGDTDTRARSLLPGAVNWKLLFQMDSDDELDVNWGDGGTLYFWVEAQAARAGRFDNAWLVLQCY